MYDQELSFERNALSAFLYILSIGKLGEKNATL